MVCLGLRHVTNQFHRKILILLKTTVGHRTGGFGGLVHLPNVLSTFLAYLTIVVNGFGFLYCMVKRTSSCKQYMAEKRKVFV